MFHCPFKVNAADMRRAISRWAKTGEPREKTPDTPASRTWLVSHVASAGLEPAPDTAVRKEYNYYVDVCLTRVVCKKTTCLQTVPIRLKKKKKKKKKKLFKCIKYTHAQNYTPREV